MSNLITARELGEMLVAWGDRPVKLRLYLAGDEDGDPICTMLHRDIRIDMRDGQSTAHGSLDLVRLTVVDRDDA